MRKGQAHWLKQKLHHIPEHESAAQRLSGVRARGEHVCV